MANEYYITAGLPAIDSEDIGSVAANAFYITAGLVANDYEAAGPVEDLNIQGLKAFGAHSANYVE